MEKRKIVKLFVPMKDEEAVEICPIIAQYSGKQTLKASDNFLLQLHKGVNIIELVSSSDSLSSSTSQNKSYRLEVSSQETDLENEILRGGVSSVCSTTAKAVVEETPRVYRKVDPMNLLSKLQEEIDVKDQSSRSDVVSGKNSDATSSLRLVEKLTSSTQTMRSVAVDNLPNVDNNVLATKKRHNIDNISSSSHSTFETVIHNVTAGDSESTKSNNVQHSKESAEPIDQAHVCEVCDSMHVKDWLWLDFNQFSQEHQQLENQHGKILEVLAKECPFENNFIESESNHTAQTSSQSCQEQSGKISVDSDVFAGSQSKLHKLTKEVSDISLTENVKTLGKISPNFNGKQNQNLIFNRETCLVNPSQKGVVDVGMVTNTGRGSQIDSKSSITDGSIKQVTDVGIMTSLDYGSPMTESKSSVGVMTSRKDNSSLTETNSSVRTVKQVTDVGVMTVMEDDNSWQTKSKSSVTEGSFKHDVGVMTSGRDDSSLVEIYPSKKPLVHEIGVMTSEKDSSSVTESNSSGSDLKVLTNSKLVSVYQVNIPLKSTPKYSVSVQTENRVGEKTSEKHISVPDFIGSSAMSKCCCEIRKDLNQIIHKKFTRQERLNSKKDTSPCKCGRSKSSLSLGTPASDISMHSYRESRPPTPQILPLCKDAKSGKAFGYSSSKKFRDSTSHFTGKASTSQEPSSSSAISSDSDEAKSVVSDQSPFCMCCHATLQEKLSSLKSSDLYEPLCPVCRILLRKPVIRNHVVNKISPTIKTVHSCCFTECHQFDKLKKRGISGKENHSNVMQEVNTSHNTQSCPGISSKSCAYSVTFSPDPCKKVAPVPRKVNGRKNMVDAKMSIPTSMSEQHKFGTDSKENRQEAFGLKEKLSLQEWLRKNRPDYIERANARQQCVNNLSVLRELRQDTWNQLLYLQGRQTNQNCNIQEKAKKPRQISKTRKYPHCKVSKRAAEKQKEELRSNKIVADIFAKKLQTRVLKGKVNIPAMELLGSH